jgi:hypothetical protein
MNMYIGPHLGQRVEKFDPIIDRSPAQKRMRFDKMRDELAEMGYSIVETGWLKATLLANLSRTRGRPRKPAVHCAEQVAG